MYKINFGKQETTVETQSDVEPKEMVVIEKAKLYSIIQSLEHTSLYYDHIGQIIAELRFIID